jgi:hypothetical protein
MKGKKKTLKERIGDGRNEVPAKRCTVENEGSRRVVGVIKGEGERGRMGGRKVERPIEVFDISSMEIKRSMSAKQRDERGNLRKRKVFGEIWKERVGKAAIKDGPKFGAASFGTDEVVTSRRKRRRRSNAVKGEEVLGHGPERRNVAKRRRRWRRRAGVRTSEINLM